MIAWNYGIVSQMEIYDLTKNLDYLSSDICKVKIYLNMNQIWALFWILLELSHMWKGGEGKTLEKRGLN